MLLATDVYYQEGRAKSVGILFEEWQSKLPTQTLIAYRDNVAPYQPGQFYQRELPCIMALLAGIDPATLSAIIVDCHVYLDNAGSIGLGGRLYQALGQKIPVIGVAKKPFGDNARYVIEVLRGASTRPLYVSAAGVDCATAAQYVRQMHGKYRIPTLLSLLDRETKRSW